MTAQVINRDVKSSISKDPDGLPSIVGAAKVPAKRFSELERAIARDELCLHFQPQVDVMRNWPQVTGYEALVRWRAADGTMIQPDDFVWVAEATGLHRALDLWVLRKAIETLSSGALDGANGQTELSVNVSSSQLIEPGFAEEIRQILEQTEVDPGRLTLEITETAFIGDPQRARETLEQLGKMGLRSSLDDFGTGFSCLSYLQHLPVDEIKIDRSFVDRLPMDSDGLIVKFIIELASSLGLSVIAEGVEDPGHVAWLRKHGCHRMQGFLFGKPDGLDSEPLI